MKPDVDHIKDKIKCVCKLLQQYKDKITDNVNTKRQDLLRLDPSSKKDVTNAFPKYLTDDEFHTMVDYPHVRKKRKSTWKTRSIVACINTVVDHVISQLRVRKEYDPLFLTDESMNVEKFGDAFGENFLDSNARARFQQLHREKLSEGVPKVCFHIYEQVN